MITPNSVRKGQRLHDTWYGNCTVLSKSKRRIKVRMHNLNKSQRESHGVVWDFDTQHAKTFLRKNFKKD